MIFLLLLSSPFVFKWSIIWILNLHFNLLLYLLLLAIFVFESSIVFVAFSRGKKRARCSSQPLQWPNSLWRVLEQQSLEFFSDRSMKKDHRKRSEKKIWEKTIQEKQFEKKDQRKTIWEKQFKKKIRSEKKDPKKILKKIW